MPCTITFFRHNINHIDDDDILSWLLTRRSRTNSPSQLVFGILLLANSASYAWLSSLALAMLGVKKAPASDLHTPKGKVKKKN